MNHNVKVDSVLNLSSALYVPRSAAKKLLHTELAQGVGTILAHFVKKILCHLLCSCIHLCQLFSSNTVATRELKVIAFFF